MCKRDGVLVVLFEEGFLGLLGALANEFDFQKPMLSFSKSLFEIHIFSTVIQLACDSTFMHLMAGFRFFWSGR